VLKTRVIVIAILVTGLLTGCGSSPAEESAAPTDSVSPTESASPEPTESETSDVIIDPTQDPIEAGVEVDFGGPPFGEGSEGEPMEGRKCTSLAFDPDYPDGVTFTVERVLAEPAEVLVEGSTCGFQEASCIGYVIDPAQDATGCSVELIIPDSAVEVFVVATEGRLSCPSKEICDEVTAGEGDD
jgi:hypothetical protein